MILFLPVVGAIFTHQSILDRLQSVANSSVFDSCANSSSLACYLLDDGGFLISTNQESSKTSVSIDCSP